MELHTTICALATPPGEGGIATVRVSGPDAYAIVSKIFAPVRQGKSVADAKGYTAMLGHYLLHGAEMDECVALFFRAPHSYTGEDVIELSVHGGTAMADGLQEALITAGCVPAGPGEFTRRALENGRMSLTQAEAVMEGLGQVPEIQDLFIDHIRQGLKERPLSPVERKTTFLNSFND